MRSKEKVFHRLYFYFKTVYLSMEHKCEIAGGSMFDVYVCQIIMLHILNMLQLYLSYKAEKEKKEKSSKRFQRKTKS